MKRMLISSVLLALLFSTVPARGAEFNEDVRDEVVGLFGTLLTPSPFTSASSEQLALTLYGRTLTAEGEVPDFDGDIRDRVDELTIFASGRLGGLGLTLGFGEGSEFEFSQPIIISADYKAGLLQESPMLDAAVDIQYSLLALPKEDNIDVSALGFGVFTVSGMLSASVLSLLEPYAALGINYVYLNSDREGFIDVWKPVPKVGLRIGLLPIISVGTEIVFIKNKHLDSAWMWNLGATIRF